MSQPSQVDILAALQGQGSFRRTKQPSTAYTSHTDPLSEFTNGNSGAGPSSSSSNNRKLYCYREECGSLIILPGAAEWTVAENDLIPVEPGSPFPPSTILPQSSVPSSTSNTSASGYWHVKGGPMAFENIGYSRPSSLSLPRNAPGVEEGKKVKWLICAECDLGPIGWSFEGGNESWLSADRVRYGAKP